MTTVDEIAPDVFRISTYVPEANLQFAQFLVRDDEPLLFETGMRALFPAVRDAVAQVIDPATLRWVSFSHFEADECGSLNEWLTIAPRAQAACSLVGALVSVERLRAPPGPAARRRRGVRHGREAIPLPPHATRPALLGSRGAVRGDGARRSSAPTCCTRTGRGRRSAAPSCSRGPASP